MKTSKLKNVAWVFFALVLTSTTVLSQGRGRATNVQNQQVQPCVTQLSNLSDEQKAGIEKLNASHQKAMAGLRDERRSTVNAIEKSEIRTEMLKKVEAHRNEVSALLSDEQQAQYNQLQASVGLGRNQANCNRRGNNNFNNRGRGKGNAGMRAQGNRGGNRGYSCKQGNGQGQWGRGNQRFCNN